MASKIVTSIKSWIPRDDETFEIVAWDDNGGNFNKFKDSTKSMLAGLGIDNNYYCNFNTSEQYFIHGQSVKMVPVTLASEMFYCQMQCQKFIKQNGYSDLTSPSFRLLVNLKFRGYQDGGTKGLFSDVFNNNIEINYPIPARMYTNECAVFEWDIVGNAVRNYFFNSTKKEFVNFKRPSWRR